ncbi:MAG: right-handed parallel beta-helix repeat-containing protein, partial [Pseudomonadota bacterium]
QSSAGLQLRNRFNIVRDNVISRNGLGISLGGHSHLITENYIGTNPAGARLGNEFDGIRLEGDAIGFNCTIGPQNVIAFNGRFGVLGIATQSGGRVNYSIIGNDIIANNSAGLGVPFIGDFGSYNLVENRVRFNGDNGIFIFGADTRTRLFSNNMYGNNGIAVDIDGGGQNPNDPGDADSGPNRLMNTPEIHSVLYTVGIPSMGIPSTLEVQYSVDATAANAAYPLSIEVFWTDRAEPMQGRFTLSVMEYNTPQSLQTEVFELPPRGDSGGQIAMMATDDDGNSSELSTATIFGQINLQFRDSFESILGD